jgi:hypothetical protein
MYSLLSFPLKEYAGEVGKLSFTRMEMLPSEDIPCVGRRRIRIGKNHQATARKRLTVW